MAEITYTDVHVTKASTLSGSSDCTREVKVQVISRSLNGALTMEILKDFIRGMELAGARPEVAIEIRTYDSGGNRKSGWLVAEWSAEPPGIGDVDQP